MALPSNALTTLATVRDELGLSFDEAQNARLERYIAAASDFVESYLGRKLCRVDGIVELVRPMGLTILRVSRAPIVEVTQVKLRGNVLTVSTDYSVDDANRGTLYRRTGWPWNPALTPSITYAPFAGSEAPDVEVTYNGGWVTPEQVRTEAFTTRTLPYDLEDAVVQLVTTRRSDQGRDRRIRAEAVMSGSVSYTAEGVAPEVLAILDRYARLSYA